MSVSGRERRGVTRADKSKQLNKIVYTASEIAQLTGFSARTIRRAFESGAIGNSVKVGAGAKGMPARVAGLAAVKGWMRRRGIET